jgi:hypothetical protein
VINRIKILIINQKCSFKLKDAAKPDCRLQSATAVEIHVRIKQAVVVIEIVIEIE